MSFNPLSNPTRQQLIQLASSLTERYPDTHGWKFGACSYKDKRRFDTVHYNPQWFDTSASVVLAADLTSNQLVQCLEQSCIDLPSSVNNNNSGLPCEYSAAFPALIYAVPLHRGLSQQQFWQSRAHNRNQPPPELPPACARYAFDPLSPRVRT